MEEVGCSPPGPLGSRIGGAITAAACHGGRCFGSDRGARIGRLVNIQKLTFLHVGLKLLSPWNSRSAPRSSLVMRPALRISRWWRY